MNESYFYTFHMGQSFACYSLGMEIPVGGGGDAWRRPTQKDRSRQDAGAPGIEPNFNEKSLPKFEAGKMPALPGSNRTPTRNRSQNLKPARCRRSRDRTELQREIAPKFEAGKMPALPDRTELQREIDTKNRSRQDAGAPGSNRTPTKNRPQIEPADLP
ncbi:MAG: hypothetical protein K2X77_04710 [Candidatus Obscuribacterales bacterium]|nr:hypothetical protein [Candidatus Obscuribacterales bacterium]